jgi:hypothetical protein
VLLAPVTLINISMGDVAIKAFSAAVIGGFGSIPGCVLGGICDRRDRAARRQLSGSRREDVVAQVILLTVLVVWPRGLIRQSAGKRSSPMAARHWPLSRTRRGARGGSRPTDFLAQRARLRHILAIAAVGLMLLVAIPVLSRSATPPSSASAPMPTRIF